MKIHYPTRQNRDLPPQQKLEKLLEKFCVKTGLTSSYLSVNITGGDWDHRISKIGVRVVSMGGKNPYSVHVLIGCEKNSVRAYLTYNGMKALEFYGKLSPHFDSSKEKFINLDDAESTTATAVTPVQDPTDLVLDNGGNTDDSESGLITHDAPKINGDSTTVPAVVSIENSYKNYFDSEANLHLAVVALVSKFETTKTLFSFAEFTDVLRDDVGVQLENMKMASIAGRFAHLDFISRINPGKSPARYRITQKAIDFTRLIPSTEKKIKKARVVTPLHDEVTSSPQVVSATQVSNLSLHELISKVESLKVLSQEYDKLQHEVSTRRRQLTDMNLSALKAEETSLVVQIAEQEQLLAKLKERHRQIILKGERAACLQIEINQYEECIHSKNLSSKHREFTMLKEELKHLTSLLGA